MVLLEFFHCWRVLGSGRGPGEVRDGREEAREEGSLGGEGRGGARVTGWGVGTYFTFNLK